MTINRQEITNIIEKEGGNNWWKPDLFEKNVREFLPKELEIVSPPSEHKNNYNCFVFVFGLQNDKEFLGGNNPIQQGFIKHIINIGVLTEDTEPKEGNLIFYRNNVGEITHGGILESKDLVISKWMWGPIIIHKIWDVPSIFGEEILLFHTLRTPLIKEKYFKYKSMGVEIRPIG